MFYIKRLLKHINICLSNAKIIYYGIYPYQVSFLYKKIECLWNITGVLNIPVENVASDGFARISYLPLQAIFPIPFKSCFWFPSNHVSGSKCSGYKCINVQSSVLQLQITALMFPPAVNLNHINLGELIKQNNIGNGEWD